MRKTTCWALGLAAVTVLVCSCPVTAEEDCSDAALLAYRDGPMAGWLALAAMDPGGDADLGPAGVEEPPPPPAGAMPPDDGGMLTGVVGEEYIVKIEPFYWFMEATTDLKVVVAGIGEDLDIEDDLAVDTSVSVPGFKSELQLVKNLKARVGGVFFSLDGSRTATVAETIEFAGTTFTINVGVALKTEIDVNMLDAAVEWDIIRWDRGYIGLLGGATILMVDARLQGTDNVTGNPTIEEEEIVAPVPVVGVAGKVYPLDRLAVGCDAYGMYFGSYGQTWNIDATVAFDILKNLSVGGGYIWRHAEVEIDDNAGDIDFMGPYAFITGRL